MRSWEASSTSLSLTLFPGIPSLQLLQGVKFGKIAIKPKPRLILFTIFSYVGQQISLCTNFNEFQFGQIGDFGHSGIFPTLAATG